MTAKLALEGLTKSFGAKKVLQGVDLSVGAGRSLVIIGASGSGKSVMLKCILGLVRPDGGAIRLDGQEITRTRGRRRRAVNDRIGMLFQGGALFDSLSVWENVCFGLLQTGRLSGRDQARERAVALLARVGLAPGTADLRPSELSGGMQKRVGLARAIATQPEILFFDEPTTGLDPIMADVINRLIRQSVSDLGATALTITHDMGSVRAIADDVAMLHEGRIVWTGPVAEMDRSGNPVVEQFIHGRAEGPIRVEGHHAAHTEDAQTESPQTKGTAP